MGLLADLISKVGVDTREFEKGLDRAQRKLIRSGRRMSLMGNDLTNNISLPLIAVGAGAIKAAADIERLELALKNTMGAGYSEELEKLTQVAKDPGLGFEQAVRGSVALQAVGQSADDARKMMQKWGNAVAAAGGTAHNLDLVIVQLQQALSKQGNLLREDWKFIVQQAPQAQKAMMDLYGTASLEELAKMGVTAQQAIRDITDELSKLGRVEGGIANAFVIFTDEMKQALVPLGKAIFESASLRETMAGLVSTVTSASKAFTGLSSETQMWIVRAGAALITLGPAIRLLGSLKLVLATVLPVAVRLTRQIVLLGRAMVVASGSGMGMTSSLNKTKRMFVTTARAATTFSAAIAGIGAMAFGAINGIRGIFNEIKNGKGQLETLREFQGIGSSAYTFQIAMGKDRTAPEITKITDALRQLGGGFENLYGKVIPYRGAANDAAKATNDLTNSLDDNEKELTKLEKAWESFYRKLRGIKELEKIFPADDAIGKTRSEIIGMIEDLVTDFGYAANSPEVKALIDQLKATRGEIQGIVKEIPKLSLLPAALSPTGGIPNLGAASLSRIEGVQKFDSSITKYYKGMRKAESLVNGVREGLYTVDQAFMALTKSIGIEPARRVWRNFRDELRKGMISVGEMMGELESTLAGGFSEAIGGMISGENPMKSFIEGLLIPLADLIKRFGQMVIAAGALTEAAKKMWLNPAAAIALGSAAIIAGTAAKNFFQKRLTSLAEGGIATGPTAAVVGDNPRSPELITPLHKLPELMRSVMGNMGGGVIRIQGELGVQGDKLSYFIDEQLDLRKSVSMY